MLGVNPVDTYIRSGVHPKLPNLPYIPGKDGAGVVHEVGSDVKDVKVGDRVYMFGSLSGSYAQYSLCNASHAFLLPDNVTFEKGACLGTPAFTAYRALFTKARAKPGDKVFIHGASGAVGLLAVQMARALDMEVVGTAGTETGVQAVLDAGATAAFNHRADNYIDSVRAVFPSGYNVCIEMLASTNLGVDLPLMAVNGRVAVVGSRGTVTINPRDMMTRELEVYGVTLFQSTPEDLAMAAKFINEHLASGALDPVVSQVLPLEEASVSHEEVISRQNLNAGNIVLVPE